MDSTDTNELRLKLLVPVYQLFLKLYLKGLKFHRVSLVYNVEFLVGFQCMELVMESE